MKKIKIILGVLTLVFAIACSSNDDIGNEEITRLYKKSISYGNGNVTDIKTINYNSDNKIDSITTISHSNVEVINVTYSGDLVSSVTHVGNPVNLITYNVTYMNNRITLISDADIGIEIIHTNGYIDSIKNFIISSSIVYGVLTFTRDLNQNLVSNIDSDGNLTTYTDFDSGKKINPFDRVIRSNFSYDYIKILELRYTNNNPTTANYISGGNISSSFHDYLTYDELGYVIRTSYYGIDSILAYEEHEYIEL